MAKAIVLGVALLVSNGALITTAHAATFCQEGRSGFDQYVAKTFSRDKFKDCRAVLDQALMCTGMSYSSPECNTDPKSELAAEMKQVLEMMTYEDLAAIEDAYKHEAAQKDSDFSLSSNFSDKIIGSLNVMAALDQVELIKKFENFMSRYVKEHRLKTGEYSNPIPTNMSVFMGKAIVANSPKTTMHLLNLFKEQMKKTLPHDVENGRLRFKGQIKEALRTAADHGHKELFGRILVFGKPYLTGQDFGDVLNGFSSSASIFVFSSIFRDVSNLEEKLVAGNYHAIMMALVEQVPPHASEAICRAIGTRPALYELSQGNFELLHFAKSRFVDFNCILDDRSGSPMLQALVRTNQIAALEFVIANRADLTAVDAKGWSVIANLENYEIASDDMMLRSNYRARDADSVRKIKALYNAASAAQ